jgi:hypothetical protein
MREEGELMESTKYEGALSSLVDEMDGILFGLCQFSLPKLQIESLATIREEAHAIRLDLERLDQITEELKTLIGGE